MSLGGYAKAEGTAAAQAVPNQAALTAPQQPPGAKERQVFPSLLLGSLRTWRNEKNPPEKTEIRTNDYG